MLAIIQEIGVIQSVIIAACFGFMLGMLAVIAGERKATRRTREIGMDQGAAWAIAYMDRYESKQVAERMARDWGFKTLVSLKEIDEYDAERIRPFIQS